MISQKETTLCFLLFFSVVCLSVCTTGVCSSENLDFHHFILWTQSISILRHNKIVFNMECGLRECDSTINVFNYVLQLSRRRRDDRAREFFSVRDSFAVPNEQYHFSSVCSRLFSQKIYWRTRESTNMVKAISIIFSSLWWMSLCQR